MATLFFRVLAHDDKEAGLAQAITDLGEARETEVAHAVDPDSFARERRRSMLTSLKLRDIGPAPRLSVELADRLNLFTGDNGLGKTFILDLAWWALTGDWAGLPALPRPTDSTTPQGKFQPQIKFQVSGKNGRPKPPIICRFHFQRQEWTRPVEEIEGRGLIIYARVDGGFSVWDPAQVPDTSAESVNG